jgi:hypothetical protein
VKGPVVAALALALAAAAAGAACARGTASTAAGPGAAADAAPGAAPVRRWIFDLAADSMEGRRTGTPGADRAARWLAAELERMGVRPGGDGGWFQRVPGAGVNVIGIVPGADGTGRDSAVVLGAHYDHLGIGPAVGGDSVYNGADDDASGVVAVLAAARALAAGPAPRRTVVVLLTTGEEVGLVGTRRYLEAPVVPLERTVAQLQVEMVGRPDPAAGGRERGWLTGFERSTMGEALREGGVAVVPDPRPEQNFFERSDNIAFARRGIPAHTLSSYGMHRDYHGPDDEAERIDLPHLEAMAEAVARAARLLADGPAPRWHPGGRPAADSDR